jgi:tetratricopeptide (TPR) repeat protein
VLDLQTLGSNKSNYRQTGEYYSKVQIKDHMVTSYPLALWRVPYLRNPFFTGRDDVLSQLHHELQVESTVALAPPQGITGLGGIGKTQTALEYAYRYYAEYDAVFWIDADSLQTLTTSFMDIAKVLRLSECNEQNQSIIVEAVLRWLRLHTRWLLVFDNIENLSAIEPFLPRAGPGHLLFTTRSLALRGIANHLEVRAMAPEIGALFLLRRAELLSTTDTLNMAHTADRKIAHKISQEVDGFPLALDQAGAYIKEAPCPLSDYLTLYLTRRQEMLRTRGNTATHYPASVATTWFLSFEQVSPAATDLLNFCAFLAPSSIPEEVLIQGAQHLPPLLQSAVIHPLQLDQIIASLRNYSLIGRNADETLNIHRLVQTVLRDDLSAEEAQRWKRRAVLAVNDASPNVEDVTLRPACERWIAHALVCADWLEQEHMQHPEAANLLGVAGYYLDARARYQEAVPLLKKALILNKKIFGPEHPEFAIELNNLAALYKNLGQYTDAEPLYLQALAIDEQAFGADDPAIAIELNNLADLYSAQGKYAQAESFAKRALAIYEQTKGRMHHLTADSLHTLATIYKNWGQYREAELLYQRALAIREQYLGPTHPDTAHSLNNLAELFRLQGKYVQAEPLLKRAFSINEQVLGPEHPDTLNNLSNLAILYAEQGKYDEAEPLSLRVVVISEQALGPEHPDLAISLNNLALLYQDQGKCEAAEPLLKRALTINELLLGPDHANTASSLNNLAMLYRDQGRYTEMEPLLKRALVICEKYLGDTHPDTAQSLDNLANLYRIQYKYGEAESLLVRALSIYEQQLGPEHPDVAVSLNNLAVLYQTQGRHREAQPLLERAQAIDKLQEAQHFRDSVNDTLR